MGVLISRGRAVAGSGTMSAPSFAGVRGVPCFEAADLRSAASLSHHIYLDAREVRPLTVGLHLAEVALMVLEEDVAAAQAPNLPPPLGHGPSRLTPLPPP